MDGCNQSRLPREYLAHVREVHLDAVLVFIGRATQRLELARRLQLLHRCRPYASAHGRHGRRSGKHTFQIEGQRPDRRLILRAFRQRAAVEVDMVRGSENEHARAAEWLGLVPGMQKAERRSHACGVDALVRPRSGRPGIRVPRVSVSDQLRMSANRVRRPTAR